ncbi:COM1 [Verticillium alfalfae VaMs.102]|uniref:COM1 n=1 Tax=Verticillium alfalfae (strain VaMs.102 / ATCC MYA-4576 / FGSC 10136) TaxID=526221 RepID=C9SH64_VERA1|nr:COM1 [Verticillium alfalfae VaMs.102]EEY17658.1 COM1 [Verticillium alfalfae VaMs.102]
MASLKVPDAGLQLEGSADASVGVPTQAFALSLPDSVIEDMIRCVQNGEDIQLSLGNSPTFLYGLDSFTPSPISDPAPADIFLTKPFESTKIASRIPITTSLWQKPSSPRSDTSEHNASARSKNLASSSASSALDSDAENLQNSMAAAEASKKHLMTSWIKMDGKADDFKLTLEKVADFDNSAQKWMLKRLYWKELDVWRYDYDSPDDRQKAIDNAIRAFDKMRLGIEEPEWQKLLPKDERGKGKILSKLQANIAKGPAVPTPKIKVQKADDGTSDAGGEDTLKIDDGRSSVRSNSSLPGKKKVSSADAQVKRLLSNKPSKPKAAPAKAPASKCSQREFISDSDSESSSNKPMASVSSSKTKRPSPAPAPAPRPKEKPAPASAPAPRPKYPPRPKPVERPAEPSNERLVDREPTRQAKTQAPVKRRRDEEPEESSSSSGAPLAKRMKPKMSTTGEKAPIRPPTKLKQRPIPADTTRNSSASNGSLPYKATKNTSPTKSSPLASSPPTNASDLEQRRQLPPDLAPINRKRKVTADTSDDGLSSKGSTTSADSNKRYKPIGQDLVRKAHKFKMFYEKYASLHREIASMDHPPKDRLADLIDMRQRLQNMKTDIYRECPPAIAAV